MVDSIHVLEVTVHLSLAVLFASFSLWVISMIMKDIRSR